MNTSIFTKLKIQWSGPIPQKIQFAKTHTRSICSEEDYIDDIESTINNLPKQKAPGPAGVNDEFYQTLEEFYIILYK